MNEKERIEVAGAREFLELYNPRMGTEFTIVELGDAPDIRCEDSEARKLNLEITLTEDRPGHIRASLGRSNDLSLESGKRRVDDIKAGRLNPLDATSCLQGNVTDMIVSRIEPKLSKDYGADVALVIRDTSGVPWSWNRVVEDIGHKLSLENSPYDKGIWIVTGFGGLYRIA